MTDTPADAERLVRIRAFVSPADSVTDRVFLLRQIDARDAEIAVFRKQAGLPPIKTPIEQALRETIYGQGLSMRAMGDEIRANDAEIARLQAKLEDERQHHASQSLTQMEAKFRESERLVMIAREWQKDPDGWDIDLEDRSFRQLRYIFGDVQKKTLATANAEIARLTQERYDFLKAEHDLSDAYVRLRAIIPGAFDTPHAPTSKQVWEIIETAARRLLQERDEWKDHYKAVAPALKSASDLCERLEDERDAARVEGIHAMRKRAACIADDFASLKKGNYIDDFPWIKKGERVMSRLVSYPLRAACINFSINPFGFWWKPTFTYKRDLTEAARADGETIWWARWGWFQISFGRWV